MNRAVMALGAAAIGVVLVGCGNSVAGTAFDGRSKFEAAKEECAPGSGYIEVLDDGKGLRMQSEGQEEVGASYEDIVCVLVELDMPQTVAARMDHTRALDGTLEATWDGIRATWSYHPDSGMSVILEQD